MKRIAIFAGVLLAALPVFAQHIDRFGVRPTAPPAQPAPLPGALAVEQNPEPLDNFWLQVAGVESSSDVSPKAGLGLVHNDPQRPWFVLAGYAHTAGPAIAHRNSVSATANYQFWTGKESKPKANDAPYLELEGDYSNTLNSSESYSALIDAGVTRGKASLDILAAWGTARERNAARVSDFIPSLSFAYKLSSSFKFLADYEFKNDVDGDAGYDAGIRMSLPNNFTIDAIVARHNTYTLRIRRDFKSFRLGGYMHLFTTCGDSCINSHACKKGSTRFDFDQ